MSKKYKVLTDLIKDLSYQDILTFDEKQNGYSILKRIAPNVKGMQSILFTKETIENSPEFFKLIEFDFSKNEIDSKLSNIIAINSNYNITGNKKLFIESLDEHIRYLKELREKLND